MADLFDSAGAIIFGGAKGIGRAVALDWARRGARLAIADIDEAAARDVAAEVGGDSFALHADVLSDQSVADAVGAAQARLGPLDIALNNVGAMLNGDPQDIPMREWQRIMDLNYFAAVRGVQAVLPGMLARQSGHIVNTASFAGLYPYAASRVPYAAAKAAVISMTQNMALQTEPQGVRFSCLVPGPVMTGVLDAMTSWTPGCPMRGPGSETTLMLPEAVATRLSEGMIAGEILIPSDDIAFDIVRRWASDPDGFVRAKAAGFAAGDADNPAVPPDIMALIAQRP